MNVVAYLEIIDGGRHKNCLTNLRGVNHDTQNMSPCYECPVMKCTRYNDGVLRVTADADFINRVTKRPYVKLIKIVKEIEQYGN